MRLSEEDAELRCPSLDLEADHFHDWQAGQKEKLIDHVAAAVRFVSKGQENQYRLGNFFHEHDEIRKMKVSEVSEAHLREFRKIDKSEEKKAVASAIKDLRVKRYKHSKLAANKVSHRSPTWEDLMDDKLIGQFTMFRKPGQGGGDKWQDGNSTLTGLPFRVEHSGVEFYPWQLTSAAHALQASRLPHGTCISTDDVGLGKTLSALLALMRETKIAKREYEAWQEGRELAINMIPEARPPKQDEKDMDRYEEEIDQILSAQFPNMFAQYGMKAMPKHKPSVVVVPQGSVGVWIDDIARWNATAKKGCTIRPVLYFSFSGGNKKFKRLQSVKGKNLQSTLSKLSPRDEESSRTLTISACQGTQLPLVDWSMKHEA